MASFYLDEKASALSSSSSVMCIAKNASRYDKTCVTTIIYRFYRGVVVVIIRSYLYLFTLFLIIFADIEMNIDNNQKCSQIRKANAEINSIICMNIIICTRFNNSV